MVEYGAGGAEPDEGSEEPQAVPAGGAAARVVGIGGSAGAIPALQAFLQAVPPQPGVAFVVVMHLAPEHESALPELLQRCTSMQVMAAHDNQPVAADTVYVIPPGKAIRTVNGLLTLAPQPPLARGRHATIDLFFRALADSHGAHAAAVVLSGAGSDGAIGIKRIKERGGLTVAQEPQEAEHTEMPRAAIDTGMVDWVLPAAGMPARVLHYFGLEQQLRLPPADPPDQAAGTAGSDGDEAGLGEVLAFLRARTGRDFSYYKRATVVRRIGRRMQVNGVNDLPAYLECLRTHPGEAGALLQDLLISVTNFFRDPECFQALETHVAELFRGKGPNDTLRVWVPACATGEEAYSIAILLAERARELEAPPALQVFATDLDEEAIRVARHGQYPGTIEADLSEERLRRYFVRELRGYQVRRDIREMVLFAQHDLLKESPFSRLDLVSCRNLLIYLKREAQQRVFEILHFSLLPQGRLFLGASESVEDAGALFLAVDKKNRIFAPRPGPRQPVVMPMPAGRAALQADAVPRTTRPAPVAAHAMRPHPGPLVGAPPSGQSVSWGDMHYRLLEALAPPSLLVNADYDILHLSPGAGRLLQFGGGEPSTNLLRAIHPDLRIETRAALLQAAQSGGPAQAEIGPVELEGRRVMVLERVSPASQAGAQLFLLLFEVRPAEQPREAGVPAAEPAAEPAARQLERELERMKAHLRDTVEQYEASTEELKASNEELQAMNEELRSATEELETSREELQSINEELTTVNQELKTKVDELAHANSDIHNLMNATAIATVFLDRELCITRFTPSAVALFQLMPRDVGRPLGDLVTQLDYPQLIADARRVLEELVPIEREVGLRDRRWFLARLLPYRTMEDRIAGVVLSFIDITERKQAEEVRLWLSTVVGSTTDAIISFSIDQTILSWNTGAERMYGYGAAEAIGQPLTLLAPGSDQPAQVAALLAEGRAAVNLETVRRRKDGTEIEVALSISPIMDQDGTVIGGTAIARDITEQKRAAEALRESEDRFRLLIENATEFAIFSLDLQRRVTTWNSGAQRLLGYAGEEIVGRLGDLIFVEEDRAAHVPEQEAAAALAEGRAADERWHERKDGSRFWGSGVAMPLRDGTGQAVGLVKILRDQTAQRASRDALERSRTELLRVLAENERARAELQAADATKDRFLAVLSHELRNPLASIDSSAALLLAAGVPAKDRAEAAEVIKRQAAAMTQLLDELLDVSRLKLGRMSLQRERTPLKAVLEAALESTRPMFAAAGHTLALDLPDQPVALDADPLRLAQVFSNLLSNAVKYTPPAGSIGLRAKVEGDAVLVSVADTGMGMEPERIEHMFEMFAQADPTARSGQGLGIGLALVKSIVELHGGTVQAHSAGRGKGSEFRVRLPLADGEAPAAGPVPSAAPEPAPTAPPPAALPKKRGLVLIADDNVDAAWGISRLLEIAGFATLRVKGGLDAVKETRRHKPDVGVIDIGMPDLDGHEVARRIRQTEWGKHMVLIAATGWGQDADERAALAAGFDAHMTKPVDLRKLSAAVDELLARKRG